MKPGGAAGLWALLDDDDTTYGAGTGRHARGLDRGASREVSMYDQERRHHARTSVSWHVRLWSDRGVMPGMADDVSDHGLHVITAQKADVRRGRFYLVDVFADAGVEHRVVAEVRHADEHGRIGFATLARWDPPLGPSRGDAR